MILTQEKIQHVSKKGKYIFPGDRFIPRRIYFLFILYKCIKLKLVLRQNDGSKKCNKIKGSGDKAPGKYVSVSIKFCKTLSMARKRKM